MKCKTKYCRNEKKKGHYCHKCAHKRQREKSPLNMMKHTFNNLRGNARRRGHDFELTFGEFQLFCERTGYMDGKGKKSTSLSVDRINPKEGYYLDNLQVLSLSDNSRKRWVDYFAQCGDECVTENDDENENLPF